MVKFRDVGNETLSDSETSSSNETTKMTDLQLSWGPYLSMAAMIPNVTMLLVSQKNWNKFLDQTMSRIFT